MPYAAGDVHVVTDSGHATISQPIGLVVALAGIPDNVSKLVGDVDEFWDLGRVLLGSSLGWLPRFDLTHVHTLLLPLPDSLTELSWTLLAGITATVTELVVAPPPLPGQDASGTLTVGGAVETNLSTWAHGPVSSGQLPVVATFYNDNAPGGAYLQGYVRCGPGGTVWGGVGPITPGGSGAVTVTGFTGCELVASGYVADAASGAGTPPVAWRVHWDWVGE